MATAYDLKTRLRLRLGEMTDGTWAGDTEYQGSAGGASPQPIDELRLLLNEAQVSVLRDIFTHQWIPFRRLNATLPIFSGQTLYTLPQDYIQAIDIYHHKPNESPLRLTGKILSYYRELDSGYGDTNAALSSYFEYYEVAGQTGMILAEGTVTWVDQRNQFAADTVNLTEVRIGDLVTNVTDTSQGQITNFGSGIATMEDGLFGGRSNYMQVGDEFIIQSREESRFTLEVWPPINIPSPKLPLAETNFEDGSLYFRPDADGTIESLELRLKQDLFLEGGHLENYKPQDRLLLYIIDTDEDQILDIIGFQRAMAGINELKVIESEINKGRGNIQFYGSSNYRIYLVAANELDTVIDTEIHVSDLELLQPTEDYLSINYVKRPAPFIIDASICELSDELHEALIEKAALTALRKKNPSIVNGSILQYYKIIIADVKEYLINLQPPHAQTIDSEDRGVATHTPGMTSYYW